MDKRDLEAVYSLSPSQQGMLFETLAMPESGLYIEQAVCPMRGKLDSSAFQEAWRQVLNRHVILRTCFAWKEQNEPLQVVLRQVPTPFERLDWRGQAEAEQQDRLEAYLAADRQRGFNLSKPPLVRLALVQTGEERYQLVWTHHHILMDGGCISAVLQDFVTLYQACALGQPVQLPTPRPYRDYITWLKQQDMAASEVFWRKSLQGFTQPVPLGVEGQAAADGPASPDRYQTQELRLAAADTSALMSLAKTHRVTLNVLVQGIWAALLSRYSGEQDIVFGNTVQGRSVPVAGIESMLGLFMNTLPLRIKVAPEMPWWNWLQDIQDINLELQQYEYSSAGLIHQCSQAPGSLPLYESILVFENYALDKTSAPAAGLTFDISQVRFIGGQTRYPLTLLVMPGSELHIKIVHDCRRIGAVGVNRILAHWQLLLKSLVAQPEQSLAELVGRIPSDQIPMVNPAPHKMASQEAAFTAPRTPTEELLAGIWANVLKMECVGVDSNFFELGGHSLLATQVMSRIRDIFQVELPLRKLFESPTIAALAKSVDLARQSQPEAQVAPMSPASREEKLPLSFAQQRLWFLNQLEPGNPFYNIPATVRLMGQLDSVALEQSLNEIIHRHEILRTTFTLVEGQPVQVIAPELRVTLQVLDLSEYSEAKQAAQVMRQAKELALHPFDLTRGPMVRAMLLRLDEREHVFLLGLHHISWDDWSTGVFIRELVACYQAFSASKPVALPDLPIQYADFAVWQRQWLQGAQLEAQLAYWKGQLGGRLPVLDLSVDHPRPPVQTYHGARYSFSFSQTLSGALQSLSRQENTTLFMTLLAAFKTLLYRYTGQNDIIVGSPIAGRNRVEVEGLIGFFVNTLALRTDLAGNPQFRQLLKRVQETTLGAYAHQDLPFEKLVEGLHPERDLSRSPIFQVMFLLRNVPTASWQSPGLALEPIEVASETSIFDLTLSLIDTDQGLSGCWDYNTDLFDAETIARLTTHFQTLVEGIVAQPALRLLDLPLLPTAERQQIVAQWNDTAADYSDGCLHHLIEAQVKRTPEATAVADESEALSYRELNQRADRLARYLQQLGVGPDVLVAICTDRSAQMIMGLLGILKAGGAYLPLDPAYPPERLTYMLQDSRAPVLLTLSRFQADLPASQARVVCLDGNWAASVSEEGQAGSSVSPDNLAYVLYTSGSTGKPKGVQIPHRAVVNFIESMRREPGLTEKDVFLAVTTLSFDIAGLELYLPLVVGGQVVLASRETAADGVRLLALLKQSGATAMQATPATWRLLLEAGWAGSPNLKLLCGGEAFPRELANQLVQRCASLWNMYGPTETTIWSALCQVPAGTGPVPIGRPIANTQIYLLDAQLQPVPVGVPGELYIGGDGLARGYLGRPELTAEKFIPNPFAPLPLPLPAGGARLPATTDAGGGSRLYKVGDLARYRPNGAIEFLGRTDHQVKIRGFRVETGEIESVLLQHPGVREGVVAAREEKGSGVMRLVAYLVPAQAPAPTVNELRGFLKQALPDYMVPSVFMMLEAMPLTPNGKVDRRALPEPEGLRPNLDMAFVSPQGEIERVIAKAWQAVLKVERVGAHDNFFDLGGHSLLMAQVLSQLQETWPDLSMMDLFKYPTVSSLAKHLNPAKDGQAASSPGHERAKLRRELGQQARPDVAIIGMSGRFPGAASVEAFWANLAAGVESVSFFSDEELIAAGVDPQAFNDPNYVKANSILDNVDLFDAGVFGMTPKEASITDPQHRLFLECAWEALERAGYDSYRYPGRIGTFAGVGLNTYLLVNLHSNWPELQAEMGLHPMFIGNDKDYVPTRVSYKLNLRGPSVTVQTACSTSLVAVHEACQSLLSGECDIALAGGATISLPQKEGYVYHDGGIPSPDGHCRAFDADARGTIRGNGVGLVVLKRLSEALADGDCIYAVIKGSAINNDGSLKVGYTAPSVEGQAEVIAEAQAVARVEPESIRYIEAHGTGTQLGDPVEIAALTQAFRAGTSKTGFCAIGSVKTNVGHLDSAAGVAGLVKTALALYHKAIPPSLHFEQPNPKIDFANSPFYVNTRLAEWPADHTPRRAGVSSFGIGGTNAHVVLEESPALEPSGPSRPHQLLMLSAQTPTALEAATTNLADYMKQHPELDLADVAYTLQVGRRVFSHRRFVVCSSREDAIAALEARDPKWVLGAVQPSQDRPVVFMFSGQGAQYVNMARELYESEPGFRETFDRCAAILEPHLDVRQALYPVDTAGAGQLETMAQQLKQTALAQPALFAVEYALAHLWMSWGVRPQAMIGHSIGEYVAACLAGVFSLEDALALVAARGRLMQSLPAGAMLVVPLPPQEVQALLDQDLSLAAINGPSLCVVSGPMEAVEKLERQLAEQGVNTSRLHTSHAFHSSMMEPILEPFVEQVKRVQLNPPCMPYVSNVTGTWATVSQATDPAYWATHLRQTVRFANGLSELLKDPSRILLEVGPGQTLCSLARQHPDKASEQVILNSLRHPQDRLSDLAFLLNALGRLWSAGLAIDTAALYAGERRRRVLLPTYPFERQRYWIDPKKFALSASQPASFDKKQDIADWFYLPVWKPSTGPKPVEAKDWAKQKSSWMVFSDSCGLGAALVKRLEQLGLDVITVQADEKFAKVGENTFTINPNHADNYEALSNQLRTLALIPQVIVHLWNVYPPDAVSAGPGLLKQALGRNFYSLLFLAQIMGKQKMTNPVQIGIVSDHMQPVMGETVLCPEKATLLGPCKVLPQEYSTFHCQSIDVALPEPGSWQEGELVEQLIQELVQPTDSVVALRQGQRWAPVYEATRLNGAGGRPWRLREEGVYLITGGLGGMGLTLADYLAKTVQAKLVLTDRWTPPARKEWAAWLSAHDEQDKVSQTIRRAQALEEAGAQVKIFQADVTDLDQVKSVVKQACEQFGTIHGVIHTAGLAGGGLAQLKTAEAAANVLAPKVNGTLALQAAFQGMRLDFMVLCSSINAVAGGFGQIDYCAANAFLDAFAHSSASGDGLPVTVINWDEWQVIGMSVNTPVPPELKEWREKELLKGVLPGEGVEVFSRVLRHPLPQVLVSTRDFLPRLEQGAVYGDAMQGQASAASSQPAHPRPALANPYIAPRNPTEQSLVNICQKLLGIEPVGIHDNVFELGCDSLIAIQFVAQIKKEFGAQISPVTLFEVPTISMLAELLKSDNADRGSQAEQQALQEGEARAGTRKELSSRRRQGRRKA